MFGTLRLLTIFPASRENTGNFGYLSCWEQPNGAALALGSALTIILYPHRITGVLSASSGRVVRRNAALLPAIPLCSVCSRAFSTSELASHRREIRDAGALCMCRAR